MVTKVGLYYEKRNKKRPWIVRWFGDYDPETSKHRHYSEAFALKREAEAFQASKQDEMNKGGSRDQQEDITIEVFAKQFLESKVRNRRASTKYNYKLTLDQMTKFLGPGMLLRKVSPELADRFVATRQRVAKRGTGYSPWSRNRHLGNAKIIFNAAVLWGYIQRNPFSHIRADRCTPRRWHHLKPEEFQKILDLVDDPRWQAFYLLAYTTGGRFGELFNLTWSDVDFEKGVVTIRDRSATAEMPSFHVKDYESRVLMLPKRTLEGLTKWQTLAPEGVPYILLSAERWARVSKMWRLCRANKPWKRNSKSNEMEWGEWQNRYMINNVLRTLRIHIRKAGVKLTGCMTIHTLRKSFGQNHADAGTPIHVLQRLMGHADITTTREFYLTTADANDRDALARYEALLEAQSQKTCVRIAYGPISSRTSEAAPSESSSQSKG